ncbi:hypothetical protein LTR37_011095 [Vermiconidia calcicola]|uniref:Uncharacterized protein n=1 Tax=Vermiconidia calcicola TaxID=1690605 RepID=A0ACC3N3B3_9PEZI|nr:hypothetical protein LTR37_011095 [Vermiconidia calcicola]
MAAGRTLKSLISRRRRAGDEEEDEEGSVLVEDSQSEGSVLSEAEDDEDADVSSAGGPQEAQQDSVKASQESAGTNANGAKAKKARMPRKKTGQPSKERTEAPQPQSSSAFKAMTDTEAMMNGLKIGAQDQAREDVLYFESMGQPPADSTASATISATNGHAVATGERQRREHDEYKKKRDSNPAFIPNRGNFFMHDTRGQPNGQAPPQRGVWQGRGRGRGGANVGGPFSPANQMASAERAAEQPWKHDLHQAVNEEVPAQTRVSAVRKVEVPSAQADSARLFPRALVPPNQGQPRVISFDSTTLVGKVQIRVSLLCMKAPIVFAEAPVRKYIRLPHHRPPLRRDKPVRVSLPGHTQRYIFPATDRSFIFIPRQMRPNQQGFHRGQYQRSVGGYGYSSRRTSMYGGSVYSASVAPSRRSSIAGASRDHAFSPAGSFVGMPPSRPVVRLPHGSQHFSTSSTPLGPMSGPHTPTGFSQLYTYPLPQQPQFQGTPTNTVHQPRPQKTISVTGIESPAMLQQVPSSDSQPFQNQLPAHMHEQPTYPQQAPPPYFSPRQQYQYPPQPRIGTPLSGIPEQAMQAPPFQPPAYGQPPYYAQYPPQQNYYYSPPGPNGYPQMPVYMMAPPPPPPPPGYMVPAQAPPMPAQQPPAEQQRPESSATDQQLPSGMVAHESNGMVFYVPASEAQQSDQYQPAEGFVPSYAMPGLPPPTPAPDSQMPYYYPQMSHSGMQEVGTAVYYPAQQ